MDRRYCLFNVWRAFAEFAHGALIPKNASVTIRIKPPPAIKIGTHGGGGSAAAAAVNVTRAASASGIAATAAAAPRAQMCVG